MGEATLLEEEEQQPRFGTGHSAGVERVTTVLHEFNPKPPSDSTIRGGKLGRSGQSGKLGGNLLSAGDVMSASLTQAALWASTRDVIWAMLAAACRQGRSGCSTPENQQSTAERTGAGCVGARRAACALLGRVFDTVTTGGEEAGNHVGLGGKEVSAALDRWYEGFCSATAPTRGGDRIGGGSFLLQEEAPRLLSEAVLGIPAVRAAFVQRGLAAHLANALNEGLLGMRSREVSLCHHHVYVRYAPDGDEPPSGMNQPPENDPGISRNLAPFANSGGRTRRRGHDANGEADLPWWLLFSQERGEREGGGHGRGFSDIASPRGGGSIDAVGAEVDGRSCQTALDEIFAPGRGKEERGADTSREDDPADGNSLGPAGGIRVSATAKQRECREREEVVHVCTSGVGADSTKTGRVAPPMLRLDALGAILGTAECTSARFCTSHAVASLSAASTRAASEHLVRSSAASTCVLAVHYPPLLKHKTSRGQL